MFVRDSEENTNSIGSGNVSDRCLGANGPRGDPEFVCKPWRTMGMHAVAKRRGHRTAEDCDIPERSAHQEGLGLFLSLKGISGSDSYS